MNDRPFFDTNVLVYIVGQNERTETAEALLAAISYSETRTYVRRVLANRRAYRLALPADEAIGGRR